MDDEKLINTHYAIPRPLALSPSFIFTASCFSASPPLSLQAFSSHSTPFFPLLSPWFVIVYTVLWICDKLGSCPPVSRRAPCPWVYPPPPPLPASDLPADLVPPPACLPLAHLSLCLPLSPGALPSPNRTLGLVPSRLLKSALDPKPLATFVCYLAFSFLSLNLPPYLRFYVSAWCDFPTVY